MNVALIVPEFPPDSIGGGGVVFEALAQALRERKHGVRVLTSQTHGSARADDRHYPFPVHRVPQLRHFTPQFKTYMPPAPLGLNGVRSFLAGSDVYHLHGYGMAFIDTIFNFFVPAHRAVFTTHGFPYTARRPGHPLRIPYAIYDALFGSRVLKFSARATAVSTQLAKEAQAASRRDVRVIPNGFVPLRPAAVVDADLQREMARGRYLLGVGRLERLKGFRYAIEALAMARMRDPDLRLVLAGPDNGEEDNLRARARDLGVSPHVSFLGRVPRDQLAHVYAGAACVVVSSEYESFSLVTLEAMSCGAPCAAAAVGGILDIAADGSNALLFAPGDVPALADRIERILGSPPLKDRLVAGGRATLDRFSWDNVAAQYEREYASVLQA